MLKRTNIETTNNDRIQIILACIIFSLMLIISLFNYGNADYEHYNNIYNEVSKENLNQSFDSEIGFNLFILLAKSVGIKYQFFRGFYLLIACLLTARGIYKLTNNYGYALCCYLVYPFLIEMVQMRQFFAFSLVLTGLTFFTKQNIKTIYKALIYVGFVILASTQHITAIVYLVLLLCLLPNEKLLKIIVYGLFVALALVFATKNKLYAFVVKLLKENTELVYRFNTILAYINNPNISIIDFYRLVILAFTSIILTSSLKVSKQEDLMIKKLIIISIVFSPFLLLDLNCSRFFRQMLVFYYIGLSHISDKKYKLLLPLMLSILFFFDQLTPVVKHHWINVTLASVKSNYILGPIFTPILAILSF